jgi:hypothetical protein
MMGRGMGLKWTANLTVQFEMEDGKPERLGEDVLRREVSEFQRRIETGVGVAPTGVKRNSAKVEIVSQNHSE